MRVFIVGWTAANEIPWIEMLHYVDQIKKFGSPLNYSGGWIFGIILEGQAQETKPSKRIKGHLHRVQHAIFILICSQESQQFGLDRQILFSMEYAPVCILWNKLAVFG
jgi:hypothetical protein